MNNNQSDVARGDFERILKTSWSELDSEARDRVVQFRELILEENKKQNLTRLISPGDFYSGHIMDVRALLSRPSLEFPALDLGSGAGVPGLLAAIVSKDSWVLAESEKRKADFLEMAVDRLGLRWVHVYSGRAEEFLKTNAVQSVVCRAIGKVEKIYRLIRKCSTWNKLVLLKGPKWDEEWAEFLATNLGRELNIVDVHRYAIVGDAPTRMTVCLKRV